MNLPEGYSLQNGKYQLTKVIGQGGFGITYLGVWNTEVKGNLGTVKTEVPVCIKEYFFKDYCFRDQTTFRILIHSETGKILFDKFKEKLIKEAKILSDVHHPYIVNVLEVFEENNTAYIAMEHIAGCSLKYMLDVEEILPENKVLRYISQIGQALEFVHQKNILHLDIKPSNILIDKKNNARLIDFGVSKRYDIEQQETSTTMLTLSKGFAPIEQYDNEGTQSFSPCPDIYSLGATMYNLLTGEIPTESILRATKPLVKPSEINKEISSKTETAILTAMQVNPIHRYQSVKAMINELDIPSYFEDIPNLLVEDMDHHPQKDTEGTELLSESGVSQPADEEQTHVNPPEVLSRQIRRRKRKRRILIPFLIIVFAFLGYGVAYLWELNGSPGSIMMPAIYEGETVEAGNAESTTSRGESTLASPPVEPARPEMNSTQAANPPVVSGNQETPPDEEEVNTPSEEERDAAYDSLMESGYAKKQQNNFEGAKVDFEEAKKLKVNPDVIHLIDECDIEIKKTLYDFFTLFGNLSIVREKATDRWGAFDNQWRRMIIPCIYLSSHPSEERRAFRREDGLYDHFDTNGQRVRNGEKSY